MKKIVALILSGVIILCGFSISAYAVENVAVYVNGTFLETDQPAIIVEGRTLVPLRAICEALACEVLWDNETQTATIQNDFIKVGVQINNYKMKKVQRYNDTPLGRNGWVEIDVPPIIYNNRTMVPARAISEALGASVEWDNQNRCVNINMEFYEFVRNLNDRTVVKQWDKYGVISSDYKVVIPVIYDNIDRINGGFYKVVKDNKSGALNENGEIVVPIIYEAISSDNTNGYIQVKQNGKWGIIDYNCNVVIPIEYDEWLYSRGSNCRYHTATQNGKEGIVDVITKKVVVPCIYDFIQEDPDRINEGFFDAKLKGESIYIDISSEQ